MAAGDLPFADQPRIEPVRRAVVVVDIVESVRLMAQDERDVIARWRWFLGLTRAHVLPKHRGRMVKSLGDGMLLEFGEVAEAVAAALEIQGQSRRLNEGHAPEMHMHLRAGIHECDLVVDDDDVFGAGVNVAARLAALAAPAETVISVEAQQRLLVGVDAEVEDMGECYVKHLERPIRAFKLWPVGSPTSRRVANPVRPLRPTLAVAPIQAPGDQQVPTHLAQVVTDNLVAALGRVSHWMVTSRLSTAALFGREMLPRRIAEVVGAQYVLAGHIEASPERVRLDFAVYEASGDEPLWSGSREGALAALFSADDEITRSVVSELSGVLLARQWQIAHVAALPNLPGYSLLLHAVALLHSLGEDSLRRASEALQHLVYRHPRAPEAKAWLAKWHFLRLAQVSTSDFAADVARARGLLAAALDEDPEHPLALAIDGHMMSFVDGNAAASVEQLQRAVRAGPNEPLAWLFLSRALTNVGRWDDAVGAVEHAQGISPMDPLGYLYDLLEGCALSAAGRHEESLHAVQRSLARNALHLSTWVQLIIEQVHTNRIDDARRTAQKYLAMRPSASVQRFLDRHSARQTPLARRDADALLTAGLPR